MSAPTAKPSSAADAILAAGNQVGRYFSLTSAVPSLVLILWTYALITSGAVTGRPDPARVVAAFTPTTGKIVGLAAVVLTAVLVGLFTHPLQFGITQLLEGYWGSNRLAVTLRSIRTNVYRRRARNLTHRALSNELAAYQAAGLDGGQQPDESYDDFQERVQFQLKLKLEGRPGDPLIRYVVAEQEAATLVDLNRFALYDSMQVPRPRDLKEERRQNRSLMAVLEGSGEALLRYRRDGTEPSMPLRVTRPIKGTTP